MTRHNTYEVRSNNPLFKGSVSMAEDRRALRAANGQPGDYLINSDFGRPMTVRVEYLEEQQESLPEFDL